MIGLKTNWKPLNVMTSGKKETDNISRTITTNGYFICTANKSYEMWSQLEVNNINSDRQNTHNWKVVSLNPHCEDHFSGTIHLYQSFGQNLWKTLTWHFCICCNPANGSVGFEEWWAYKIQLYGTQLIKCLSAERDQRQSKRKKLLNADQLKFY